MGGVKQILKIELIIFTMTWSISNLLKIDRKSYKNIGIYNTGYITIKRIDDYENIYSVNPLSIMQTDILKNKMKINT